jgi:hypothetical protein
MTLHSAWTEMLGKNFTVQDVVGSLVAVVAFALVLFAPGYLIAWATDLFGFRRRSLGERSCWAVVCSFGVVPVVAYLGGRFVGLGMVCWALVVVGAVVVWLGRPWGLKPPGIKEGLFGTAEAVPFRGEEQATAKATADPYGMTTRKATAKATATASAKADPYGMTTRKAKATAKATTTATAKAIAKASGWVSRDKWLVVGLVVAWVVFVVVSLVELQVGKRLYFSVILFDQSYRVAFTDAVARTGVPPANPLYFAGQAQPMRYYYFWYVLCAAVMRIAGVTARQAFIASSVWAGFGLVATIALYLRYFFGAMHGIGRQTLVAVGLLAVTGADLVPAIGSLFAQPALNGEMEWWSIDQFYSWQDSLLWVPHHTASLLCCLLGFLLLWRTREGLGRGQRWAAVVLAGLAFASAVGLSVYVAFGMALLMVAWVVRVLWHARRLKDVTVGRTVVAGSVAAVLLVPFLRELTARAGGGSGASGHAFGLSVRRMIDPEIITTLPVFAGLHVAHPALLDVAMRLLLLLPGLALELGFYGAVLWLLLRVRGVRERMDEATRTAIYLAVCGLVMVTFVRSSVISNNDFGYRAALLLQFFLLLLGMRLVWSWWFGGEEALVQPTRARRRLLAGLMALGVAGTVYQAVMLRAFLPIEEAHAGSGFQELPSDAYQARAAFAELNRVAQRSAVVQFNAVDPTSDPHGDVVPPYQFYTRALLMDSGRQVLNAEPECAVEFGGDAGPCAAIRAATARLYGAGAPTAAWAKEYCGRFGVGYLAVSHLDPAWGDTQGWVWGLPVVAAEPGFRIVRCR